MTEGLTTRSDVKRPHWWVSMMDIMVISIAILAWSAVGGLVALGFMVLGVK